MRVWAVMASLLPLARAGPGDTLQQLTNAVTNIRYEDQVGADQGRVREQLATSASKSSIRSKSEGS